MTGLVPIGDFEGVPDAMLADLLRNPSLSRETLMALFSTDVPAIVIETLAQVPAVEAAAANAVAGKLAEADVIVGTDKRVLPLFTKTGWYAMPESTGYIVAFVVVEQRDWWILGGFTLEGTWSVARGGDSAASTAITTTLVRDAIPEWWVGLPQWHLDTIYTGALGRKGEVLAVDFNARSGPSVVQVATAPADDHNVPGRCTVPGRGSLLAYTHHGVDSQLRVVIAGGSGRADTFTGKTVSSFNMGGAASYSQNWNLAHARTATTDLFWVFVRVALKWCVREILADWPTSTATAQGGIKQLVEFPDQAYMHTSVAAVDANGNPTKVGIIAGYNPAVARSAVYVLELDLKTGIMHDKMKPTVTQDISAANPLQSTALTPVLGDKASGTRRVLGLYCGGGGTIWSLLTVEYSGAVGADGVYTKTRFDVSNMQVLDTVTYGAAGRHFERYPAGAQFDRDGKVWHINESGNVYTLSHEGVAVRKGSKGMFRTMPVMPIINQAGEPPVDLLTGDVNGSYTDYFTWLDVNLLAIKKGA